MSLLELHRVNITSTSYVTLRQHLFWLYNRPGVAYQHLLDSFNNWLSRSSFLSESSRHCLSQNKCSLFSIFFSQQSSWASRWRVYYQRGLPRLVSKRTGWSIKTLHQLWGVKRGGITNYLHWIANFTGHFTRASSHNGISTSGRLEGGNSYWQEWVNVEKFYQESITVLHCSFMVKKIVAIRTLT